MWLLYILAVLYINIKIILEKQFNNKILWIFWQNSINFKPNATIKDISKRKAAYIKLLDWKIILWC